MLFEWLVASLLLLLSGGASGKKLIVVLIDGFRWDYVDDPKLDLKGIRKIIEQGVRAPYVHPVYPALSYPNWYSIVTGLYPEAHDIVNNLMYESGTGASFLMLPNKGSTDPHWWDKAEPVWVTAEKRGKNAAMYWWAGCEVDIGGVQPYLCERHRYGPGTEEEKEDYLERIEDIVHMFKPFRGQTDRLSLVLMYYGPVDYTGHYSGPGTSETRRALQDIDDILYKMLKKIEKAGLQNEVNLMIVSDHGMTDVSPKTTQYIDMERFAPSIKYQISYGATMMLVAQDGMLDKLYKELKDAKIKGIQIYKKDEIPDSYHLKKSPMMNDIFIKAEKGYYLNALNDSSKRIGEHPGQYVGHHGYDPDDVTDMRTVFFATGPGFRRGHTTKPMSNVDLYNMMCSVLDLKPLPNNGSVEILKDVLAEGHEQGPSRLVSGSVNKASPLGLCFVLLFSVLVRFYFVSRCS